MRWAFALLLLAATAAAQDPFAPLPERFRPGIAVPGAKARVNEELARLKQALAQKPVDVITLRRAYPLMVRLGRGGALRPLLDSAIKAFDTPELRAMRGAILSSNPGLAQIVLPKGMNRKDMERLLELLKGRGFTGLKEARADLEIAVKARPGDWSSRNTLASVLARLDKKGHKERIERLRNEAAAIRLRNHDVPAPIDLTEGAARLRERAEELEQQKTPKHDAALALRKRALVLDFCSHGIPFGSHADVWTSVALLAPGYMVRENLTRTFVTRKSDISSVDVHYYEPTLERRLEVIQTLARDEREVAAAILLSVLRRAREQSPLHAVAIRGIRNRALGGQLAKLLATALFSEDNTTYHAYGRRLLVRAADKSCEPVLRRSLARDNDLFVPLGIAAALGGDIATAQDPLLPIHFRREAVYALPPEKLAALEGDVDLELAVAAARYRAAPTDSGKGRLLNGIDRMHEAHVASRYCADLGIRAAVPAMEAFLQTRDNHYAAKEVRRQLDRLKTALRGG